ETTANRQASGEGSGVALDSGKRLRLSEASLSGTAAPAKEWSPPANILPGHEDLTLLSVLGRAAGREVWAASSARRPGRLIVVESLADASLPCRMGTDSGRFVLDLAPWTSEGWPPTALVTVLPARLPGPYSRFELISFIGLGGMGQVWMAESPDYPD